MAYFISLLIFLSIAACSVEKEALVVSFYNGNQRFVERVTVEGDAVR